MEMKFCREGFDAYCEEGKFKQTWQLKNLLMEGDELVLKIFDEKLNQDILFFYNFKLRSLNWFVQSDQLSN